MGMGVPLLAILWGIPMANFRPEPQEIQCQAAFSRHCLINLSLRQIDAKGRRCFYSYLSRPHSASSKRFCSLVSRDSDCPWTLFCLGAGTNSFCVFFRGIPRSSKRFCVNRHIIQYSTSIKIMTIPQNRIPQVIMPSVWPSRTSPLMHAKGAYQASR